MKSLLLLISLSLSTIACSQLGTSGEKGQAGANGSDTTLPTIKVSNIQLTTASYCVSYCSTSPYAIPVYTVISTATLDISTSVVSFKYGTNPAIYQLKPTATGTPVATTGFAVTSLEKGSISATLTSSRSMSWNVATTDIGPKLSPSIYLGNTTGSISNTAAPTSPLDSSGYWLTSYESNIMYGPGMVSYLLPVGNALAIRITDASCVTGYVDTTLTMICQNNQTKVTVSENVPMK